MVKCEWSGRYINPDDAIKRIFWKGRRQVTYYFSSQTALEQWYIRQLRMLGL